MKVYKCDRCGEIFKDRLAEFESVRDGDDRLDAALALPVDVDGHIRMIYVVYRKGGEKDMNKYHLCADCQDSLKTWLFDKQSKVVHIYAE